MSDKIIFVFGSNLAGIHGAGAALYARRNHGAEVGTGVGRTGDCYAIPTKDRQIRTLSKYEIRRFVEQFLAYAAEHPELTFSVTRIGCGLAGYQDFDIAVMFKTAPENCQFDTAWQPWLGDTRTYWGHVE